MVSYMERFWEALTMYEGTKSWAKWLVVEPSLEQELQLETDSRAVLEDDDHESIALLCSTLLKQNWYQQQVIKQSVERICELEAKLICLEPVPKKKKRLWFGLFGSD